MKTAKVFVMTVIGVKGGVRHKKLSTILSYYLTSYLELLENKPLLQQWNDVAVDGIAGTAAHLKKKL